MGYAKTASQLINYDLPPIPGNPLQLLATNLAPNPSFERAVGVTPVRRNLVQYSDTSSATGWFGTVSGTVVAESGRLKVTSTLAAQTRLGAYTAMVAPKAAGTYSVSVRAQAMDATLTGVRVILYDSTTAAFAGTATTTGVTTGAGDRIYSWTITTTGVFDRVYLEFVGTSINVGAVGYISDPLVEVGPTIRGFFSGTQRAAVRRNLAVNPRGTTGTAWLSNNATTNPLTMNVTPPVPHPLGITTAVEQRSTGTSSVLGTIYNFDGLANVAPQRTAGMWIMVTEAGYQVAAGSEWETTGPLTPYQWYYIKQTIPRAAGAYQPFFLHAVSGNASTTARVYMTGVMVEAGTAPVGDYFDGGVGAPTGYGTAWYGTAGSSQSYLYDSDFTYAWSGAAGASEALANGAAVGDVVAGNAFAFQSSRWVATRTRSMRIRPNSTSASSYVLLRTLTGADAGKRYTILAKIRVETPTTATGALARSFFITTNAPGSTTIQGPQAPNTPGVHDVRWDITLPSNMSGGSIRIYHGGVIGDTDIWVDDFAIIDNEGHGLYTGGYFDGATQNADGIEYQWLGAADASFSRMVIPATPETAVHYCDINWHSTKDEECFERLRYALEDTVEYVAGEIDDDAPWFSDASGYSYPEGPSRKFLGAYGLSVSALSDSTRDVGVTEGILSGGVLGRERLAVPRFRFRVMLTAVDMEGLEYGKAWLSKALSEQSCSTHGPSCGSSDLTFFAMCPPSPDPNAPAFAFEEKVNSISRMYHDVKCIEGPVTTDTFNRAENSWGMIVEFTLAAGVPNMYGLSSPYLPIPLDGETIIQDIPFNYIPYPSAELASGDVTTATNYSVNPSVETNATGWVAGADGTQITTGMLTSGRVTGELQAVGAASFRVVFTATGAGANGSFHAQQEVDLSARPAGSRVSINYWAAEVLVSGTPVRADIEFTAYWRATSGGAVLRTDTLGTVPVGGGSVSMKSIDPPAGANFVLVRASARLTSWPAGTVVRLYADALAVTVP